MSADRGRPLTATPPPERAPQPSMGRSEAPDRRGPIRSIRVAGVLAILFGIAGLLIGLGAAGTLIPFRQGEPWNQSAEVMTFVAAAGAGVSLVGVVAGWGLRRTRGWAWRGAVGVAAVCVALVAVMAAFMGPFLWGFVAIVAGAYSVEVALLLVGRGSYRTRTAMAPSA